MFPQIKIIRLHLYSLFSLIAFLAHDLLILPFFFGSERTIDPNSVPTPLVLNNLAKVIPDCWESLGLKLGVSAAKLRGIDVNNRKFAGEEKKAFEMLMIWFDKGCVSTYGKLAEALTKEEKEGLAEELMSGKL